VRACRLGVLLVTVLSLLALATSASAECAWVLWGIVYFPGSPPSEPHPILARESRADCEQTRSEYWSRAEDRAAKGAKGREVFTCLPDTVDPRGPKGR
jgi:hypothetical protein